MPPVRLSAAGSGAVSIASLTLRSMRPLSTRAAWRLLQSYPVRRAGRARVRAGTAVNTPPNDASCRAPYASRVRVRDSSRHVRRVTAEVAHSRGNSVSEPTTEEEPRRDARTVTYRRWRTRGSPLTCRCGCTAGTLKVRGSSSVTRSASSDGLLEMGLRRLASLKMPCSKTSTVCTFAERRHGSGRPGWRRSAMARRGACFVEDRGERVLRHLRRQRTGWGRPIGSSPDHRATCRAAPGVLDVRAPRVRVRWTPSRSVQHARYLRRPAGPRTWRWPVTRARACRSCMSVPSYEESMQGLYEVKPESSPAPPHRPVRREMAADLRDSG
jgi:hypothetical protein